MATEPVPFVPDQRSGLESLAGASPLVLNAIIDAQGAVLRRPGVRQHPSYVDAVIDSAGLDAVRRTQAGHVYAVASSAIGQRSIYRVTAGGSASLTSAAGTELRGTGRVVLAETEAMLLLAAGAEPQRVLYSTQQSARLPGDPPRATHVIAHASRVLLSDLDNPSQVAYSSTASGSSTTGHEQWNGDGTSGTISAESRTDPVNALHENTSDVFVFGGTTFEVHSPDPQFIYSRAITKNYGLIAPYSVIQRDQEFAWIDQNRRVWLSDGRGLTELGVAIQTVLNKMATIEDAFGYWVRTGPVDAFVWTFPTDGRTFVRQYDGGWSQWNGMGVNGADGNLLATEAGRVGQWDFDTTDDLGVTTQAILETGALGRNTAKKKQCLALRLTVKPIPGAALADRAFWLEYRDDGQTDWFPSILLDLNDGPEIVLTSLGVYRKRRWRLRYNGSAPFVLAGAEEEFNVLDF